MIKIDDSLLEELGLLSLPKEERDKLLRQIYETLEMRVGMKLAERMSDSQLDEFERFINGDLAFTEEYLNQFKPGWAQSEPYQKALQNAAAAAQRSGRQINENAVKTEFGALTWLETNFPDYKQVVAQELEKLKVEIKADSSKIVEAMQAAGTDQPQEFATPQQQPTTLQQPQVVPQQPSPQNYQQQYAPPAPDNVVQGSFGAPQQAPSAPANPQSPLDQNQQPPLYPPAQAA